MNPAGNSPTPASLLTDPIEDRTSWYLTQSKISHDADHFASSLAHEIRNPLSNINLAVEMLKSPIAEHERPTYLEIILRGTSRINDVLFELLKMGHPTAMMQEEFRLEELIEEVVEMTQDRIMLKHINVKKDFKTPIRITVNKQKFKIALTNIIINAIDAMPLKNGLLTLITRHNNGKKMLRIVDNGVGINKTNLKKIFDPYFTTKSYGMGFGLATTQEILISLKIDCRVKSQEGKGTSFILSFQ